MKAIDKNTSKIRFTKESVDAVYDMIKYHHETYQNGLPVSRIAEALTGDSKYQNIQTINFLVALELSDKIDSITGIGGGYILKGVPVVRTINAVNDEPVELTQQMKELAQKVLNNQFDKLNKKGIACSALAAVVENMGAEGFTERHSKAFVASNPKYKLVPIHGIVLASSVDV